jgi:SAM-dependent methyltransferase
MVHQAERRCRGAGAAGRAVIRCGGLDALQPEDGRFDCAFMVNVAQFLPDRRAAFARIAGALKPGGRIAITHQPRMPGATERDADTFAAALEGDLVAAGFRDLVRHRLPLKPLPTVCVVGVLPAPV